MAQITKYPQNKNTANITHKYLLIASDTNFRKVGLPPDLTYHNTTSQLSTNADIHTARKYAR